MPASVGSWTPPEHPDEDSDHRAGGEGRQRDRHALLGGAVRHRARMPRARSVGNRRAPPDGFVVRRPPGNRDVGDAADVPARVGAASGPAAAEPVTGQHAHPAASPRAPSRRRPWRWRRLGRAPRPAAAKAHAATPSRGPHPPTWSGATMASSASIASGHSRAGDAFAPVVHPATRKTAPCPAATTTEVTVTTGHARRWRSPPGCRPARRGRPVLAGTVRAAGGPAAGHPGCTDDGGRHDPPHRRAHRAVQDEQRQHGQHHEHDLTGRTLPGHGAQTASDVPRVEAVPDTAVDVADHATGQRAVEELRPVVRRDRRAQRQPDAQAARDGLPPPGGQTVVSAVIDAAASRDQTADQPHPIEEGTGAEAPHENAEDRGTAGGRAHAHVRLLMTRRCRDQHRGHASRRLPALASPVVPAPPYAAAPAAPRRPARRRARRRGRPRRRAVRAARRAVDVRPSASGTPPTAVATTGSPTASASVTTIRASRRDGRTSTSAAR